MDSQKILDILKTVPYPGLSKDLVSFGLVKNIDIQNGTPIITIEVTTAKPDVPDLIKQTVSQALNDAGVKKSQIIVNVHNPKVMSESLPSAIKIPGVRRIIAVASGKGGVGKSTVTVNLAAAFAQVLEEKGIAPADGSVGIMDCDVYGPSIPTMLNLKDVPEMRGEKILPKTAYGMKTMSMGYFLDESSAVIWRGPMLQKAIKQFISDVDWGALEALFIDLPPGTGDAQITLTQSLALDGVVIVTTPQVVASSVAKRGANLFEKTNVPLLGVVENMSYFESFDVAERQYIFGKGGGTKMAMELGCDFLGEIPLSQKIREGGDAGVPIVHSDPDAITSQVFRSIAYQILQKCE